MLPLDDVLSYMAPSLEKYKGCDILDLNPGAGLWSSKLHDFLQPRSHVLLESAPEAFAEFLDPLVQKPGSKYKLLKGEPTRYETFDRLIDEGYFPHQKRATPGEACAREPNNSLLVTGTLMWEPMLPGLGFDSMARQLLVHYSLRSWKHQLFHAFGPARMLLWTTNEDFRHALPRAQYANNKLSLMLRHTANITEIVTPEHSDDTIARNGRDLRYELESTVQAMRRMKEKGIELPAHRREDIHDFAEDIDKMTSGTGILSSIESSNYLKAQYFKGKSVAGIVPAGLQKNWQSDKARGRQIDSESKKKQTGNVKGETRLRANANRLEKIRASRDPVVDIGEEAYHLGRKILGMEDGTAKDAELQKLETLEKEFAERWKLLDGNTKPQVLSDLDDRISIRAPYTLLQWDKRDFEPLVMRPEEVWPSNRVSLADFVPRPIPEGQTDEDWEYLQDFISGLIFQSTDTVSDALEHVQAGGSELITEVDALRDPSKGGRLDKSQMRLRMLTTEAMAELCKAYRAWPFRAPDTNHPNYFRIRNSKGVKNKWNQ